MFLKRLDTLELIRKPKSKIEIFGFFRDFWSKKVSGGLTRSSPGPMEAEKIKGRRENRVSTEKMLYLGGQGELGAHLGHVFA